MTGQKVPIIKNNSLFYKIILDYFHKTPVSLNIHTIKKCYHNSTSLEQQKMCVVQIRIWQKYEPPPLTPPPDNAIVKLIQYLYSAYSQLSNFC